MIRRDGRIRHPGGGLGVMGMRLGIGAILNAVEAGGSIVCGMGRELRTGLGVGILVGIGVRLVLRTVGRGTIGRRRGTIRVAAASVAVVLRCHRTGRVRSVGNGLVVSRGSSRGLLCRSGSVAPSITIASGYRCRRCCCCRGRRRIEGKTAAEVVRELSQGGRCGLWDGVAGLSRCVRSLSLGRQIRHGNRAIDHTKNSPGRRLGRGEDKIGCWGLRGFEAR